MDLFENLPWRISEPSVLDVGTNFLKEETVAESFVFLNNFVPSKPEEEPKRSPKAKKLKNNKDKIEIPNKPECFKHSRLNEFQQKQCLQALQILETGRPINTFSFKEQELIKIYNNLRSVIYEENAEYLKFAQQKWKDGLLSNTVFSSKHLHSFALTKREHKINDISSYPKFYDSQGMVPITKNQNEVEAIHEACLLEMGLIATIEIPKLDGQKALMYYNKIPSLKSRNLEGYLENTKESVSTDLHAEFLANQTSCNIVISSSSLKTIVDNFGPEFNTTWDIPITVKEYEKNGKKFNVVYIDKTLPQRNITTHDLNVYVRKVLLKRTMCRMNKEIKFTPPPCILQNYNAKTAEAFTNSFERVREISAKCNKNTQKIKDKTDEILAQKTTNNDDTIESNSSKSPKKQILNSEFEEYMETQITMDDTNEINDYESPKSPPMETNECDSPKKQKKVPIIPSSPSIILTRSAKKKLNNSDDGEINEAESIKINEDQQKPNAKKKKKNKAGNNYTTYHNVNYRLWKLKIKEDENVLMKKSVGKKEITLIIRSKIDAFQMDSKGQMSPTNIVPKIELQPEHGGQTLTKSELIRQWSTLYFRPFSNLIRARINTKINHFVKIENINLNKISHECVKQNLVPKDSIGVLFNVLSNLTDLAPGNYLLHHTPKHGAFASLLKSVPENSTYELNLHDMYKKENCTITHMTKWIPIDTNLILNKHLRMKRMPGMFPPYLEKKQEKYKKGKTRFSPKKKRKSRKPEVSTSSDSE